MRKRIFFLIGFFLLAFFLSKIIYPDLSYAWCDGWAKCGVTEIVKPDPKDPSTWYSICNTSGYGDQGCWVSGGTCSTFACADCIDWHCGSPPPAPTSTPAPTPYHKACSGTSCVNTPGSGSDQCSSSCSSQSWGSFGSCSNSCGGGTKSRTCNCIGDCCSGCSDPSVSCSGTDTQNCCHCSDSCACDACGNSCGSYCGNKSIGGKRCCGSSCEKNCTITCPCNPCCPSGCDCGSNSYCCGESCGNDGCGGSCGTESDSDHWTGCVADCSCGSNAYCCGEDCGSSVCGNWCGTESSTDVGNCASESGDGRYCGTSLPNDPCGGDCGNEADYRSSSWSSPVDSSSFVHDLPFTVSGWAKDTNGANAGVNSVSININGTSGYTANANASTGSFSKSIITDFYSLGFTGAEAHTINLTTNPRDPEDCPDWSLGTRNINITNSSPGNISFSPNSGNLILDHDPDGNNQVEFIAIFNDADLVPAGRYHDVRYGKVRFGETANPLLLLQYTDNGDSTYGVAITGGSEASNITLANFNRSKNANNLTINFTLDFTNMSPGAASTYNIYQSAQDWAGAVANWSNMGTLIIWNGADISVSGRVYNTTYYYPNTICSNLDDSDPHAPGLASPQITFRRSSGPGSTVNVNANGSGNYSTLLTYGTTYVYTLSKPDHFTSIADVSDATLNPGDCLLGGTAAFTLNNGPTVTGLDFGMAEVKDPWIQIVGGDLASYGSISNLIPSTCVNDYNAGGCCLPFISINRLPGSGSPPCHPDLFSENGLVAAQVGPAEAWYGDGVSSGYPHDWQVVTSLWRRPTGTGFTYFRNLFGEDYVLTGNKDISSSDLDSAEGTVSDGHVGSTEKVIKLIDGNLTINQNTLVDSGGILLLVVSGNIIVNGDVDRADGIFSADDNININSGAAGQAILQGSWSAGADESGTLTNSRNLGTVNNLNPTAVFQYRPDFMVNLLKQNEGLKPKIKWEEVKP